MADSPMLFSKKLLKKGNLFERNGLGGGGGGEGWEGGGVCWTFCPLALLANFESKLSTFGFFHVNCKVFGLLGPFRTEFEGNLLTFVFFEVFSFLFS